MSISKATICKILMVTIFTYGHSLKEKLRLFQHPHQLLQAMNTIGLSTIWNQKKIFTKSTVTSTRHSSILIMKMMMSGKQKSLLEIKPSILNKQEKIFSACIQGTMMRALKLTSTITCNFGMINLEHQPREFMQTEHKAHQLAHLTAMCSSRSLPRTSTYLNSWTWTFL